MPVTILELECVASKFLSIYNLIHLDDALWICAKRNEINLELNLISKAKQDD